MYSRSHFGRSAWEYSGTIVPEKPVCQGGEDESPGARRVCSAECGRMRDRHEEIRVSVERRPPGTGTG
jgi:hypothetical protein